MKLMPVTGRCFVVGAVAICGLPPLNGFMSELLIYAAAFTALCSGKLAAAPLVVIVGLAIIGGLAAACFTKVVGIVFLGEPRHAVATQAHEPGSMMTLPMGLLALGCLGVGLLAPAVYGVFAGVLSCLPRLPQVCVADALSEFARFAQAAAFAGVGVLAVAAAVLLWRRWLLAERTVKTAVTWDCGYVAPTARMQYTASSYVHPVTRLLGSVLPEHHDEHPPAGVLPRNATFVTYHPDPCREWFFAPLFRRAYRLSMVLHRVQLGSIQLYIAYIAITLLILMVWQLG